MEIEPTRLNQAQSSHEWHSTMQEEYDAFLKNKTWTLCPRPPQQNLIQNKWVYKIKRKPDGFINHFEARLIAKGFDQRSGIDYTETFNPVIKPTTIRLVLALVVQFDWKVKQLDVSNAFLHWTPEEDVLWNNHKVLWTHNFPPLFVSFIWPYTVSNRHLELGSIGCLSPCKLLVFQHHWLIPRCLCFTLMVFSYFYWSMLMTSCLQETTHLLSCLCLAAKVSPQRPWGSKLLLGY
jgi:hypothetical protein